MNNNANSIDANTYINDGFLSPVNLLDPEDAHNHRIRMEAAEKSLYFYRWKAKLVSFPT